MPSLKEVKNRITSVKSTQQITKAMKMVAAAKLRRAQEKIVQLRPFSSKLSGILDNVSSTMDSATQSPYHEKKAVDKVLIVIVTSDRGLCGGFNSAVNRAVLLRIQEQYAAHLKEGRLELLPIGTKGRDFFQRREFPLNQEFVNTFADLNFDSARAAAEYAMNGFLSGRFGKVEVVYNEFKNVATQILKVEHFLPVEADTENTKDQEVSTDNLDYIFEPDKEQIVQELIPYTLKINFYRFLLESNAAEHGARMTAMDQATDNAQELLKQLNLTYNRTRQAAITKEILEIVGGAEALGGS